VYSPVLVAALVLEVDHVAVVLGPEAHPDAALAVVCDGLEVLARPAPDGSDPDVQYAVSGGDVGETLPIG
jgi:hypothetical protein